MISFSKDMLFFGKTIRPKIFEVSSPAFHRQIAAYLKREEYRFINIIAPRGFAKTTITAFVYVLWHIFVEDFAHGRQRRPKFVVLVSKSRAHSVNLLTTIKNCLEFSIPFKKIFGYYGEHSAITWREGFVKLKDGTIIDCRGMGQQVRGMNIDGRRPTLIVLDDAEDEENTKTDESIRNNNRWFHQALVPMVKSTYPHGRIVNIGTPQHQSCLVFDLKNMKRWQTLHYSAIIDNEGEAQSLWPEMKSLKELEEIKSDLEDVGRISSFYREYMCQVVGDNDALVTMKEINFWQGTIVRNQYGRTILKITHSGNVPGVELPEPKDVEVFTFIGVDPASTLSVRSDYSVIFVIGMDEHRNIYCLDYFRKRVKPMQLAHKIIEYFELWRPERTRIESVGYQEMIRDYLRNEYNGYIPGLEIKHNPRTSKSHRLEGLQPEFAAGKVYIRENMTEFIDELVMFPRAKHDDTLDGYYYARLKAYGPIVGRSPTEQAEIEDDLKHFMLGEKEDPTIDWLLA